MAWKKEGKIWRNHVWIITKNKKKQKKIKQKCKREEKRRKIQKVYE